MALTQNNTGKNRFSVPRRSAWYLLRLTLITAVIVALVFFTFLLAMNAANIYIIVTEGLTLRVACVLGDGDPNEMYEYFVSDFVINDDRLLNNVYSTYVIDSYNYTLDLNSISVWPWGTRAQMIVTERVPLIVGSETATSPASAIPEWEAGKYRVSCIKLNGRWYIEDIVLIETNPPYEVKPTPNMSLTPITQPSPSATPTPSVTPTSTPATTPTASPNENEGD